MPTVGSNEEGVLIAERIHNAKVDCVQLAMEDTDGNRVTLHFVPAVFETFLKEVAKSLG